ncbi:transglutaminase family protein [Leifsonia aquatica]|uniref:transglutaminase-like domain-containing protein n=1 Tax=Leifsonia aquatica TaxID=144185 RepID=UPI00384DACBE
MTSFVKAAGSYTAPNIAAAVERLHDAVRDGIDYNVFNVPLHTGLSATAVVRHGAGFCLHKSVLFVAGCRKLGVPAVLCSDIVTNHVADPAMIELVGGAEFLHWYAKVYLNGRWIKAAPVFNTLLCSLYGIEVLRFSPHGDAVKQKNQDNTSMQFSGAQREYPEARMDELIEVIRTKHPRMITETGRTPVSHHLAGSGAASWKREGDHVDD